MIYLLTLLPFLVAPAIAEPFESPKMWLVWGVGAAGVLYLTPSFPRKLGVARRLTTADAVVAFWLFTSFAAAFRSPDPQASWLGSSVRMAGFVTELAAVGWYLLARSTPSFSKKPGVGWFTGGGALLAVGGLLSLLRPAVFLGESGIPRASGTLGHPDFLGLVLAATVPFAHEAVFRAENKARCFWSSVALGAVVVGLLATFSRGALLAAAVGALWWSFGRGRRTIVAVGSTIVVVVFAIAAAFVLLQPRVDWRASIATRRADWSFAVRESLRAPLGHGQETYGSYAATRLIAPEEALDGFSDRAHNIILDEWFAKGIPGLVAILTLVVVGIRLAWYRRYDLTGPSAAWIAITVGLLFIFHFSVTYGWWFAFLGWLSTGGNKQTVLS